MKNKLKPNKSQKTNADESVMWNCGTNDSVSAQQEQSGTSPRDAQAEFLKRSQATGEKLSLKACARNGFEIWCYVNVVSFVKFGWKMRAEKISHGGAGQGKQRCMLEAKAMGAKTANAADLCRIV